MFWAAKEACLNAVEDVMEGSKMANTLRIKGKTRLSRGTGLELPRAGGVFKEEKIDPDDEDIDEDEDEDVELARALSCSKARSCSLTRVKTHSIE